MHLITFTTNSGLLKKNKGINLGVYGKGNSNQKETNKDSRVRIHSGIGGVNTGDCFVTLLGRNKQISIHCRY